MAYILLLNKLPICVVYHIHMILKQDEKKEIISKYISLINNKNNLIKNLLNYKLIINNNITNIINISNNIINISNNIINISNNITNNISNNNNNNYIITNNNNNNYISNIINNNNLYYCKSNKFCNDILSLLSTENYNLLKNLYINSLNRKRIFWLHLMNLFGEKLNIIRNFILMNKIKLSYTNIFYYKRITNIWNRICFKFNLKLKMYFKNKKINSYFDIKLPARKLYNIKNLFINYKLLYFPIILDDTYNIINYNTSELYIYKKNVL